VELRAGEWGQIVFQIFPTKIYIYGGAVSTIHESIKISVNSEKVKHQATEPSAADTLSISNFVFFFLFGRKKNNNNKK
jgi:hypothetical protein